MQQLAAEIDFHSDTYKDAYSRINAIVIEGEQEAHENYIRLAELLPEQKDDLIRLSENRHKKGFEACGRNLQVMPDMQFARELLNCTKISNKQQRTGGYLLADPIADY